MPRIHVEADHSLNLFRTNLTFPGLMLRNGPALTATSDNQIARHSESDVRFLTAMHAKEKRTPCLSHMEDLQLATNAETGTQRRALRVMEVTWSLVAGGSEMYAYKVACGLDRQRYRAFICAVDEGGALESEVAARGIPFFVMNRRPGIDLKMMWHLFRLFRRTRVDVVQTHHFNQLFYSAIGARLSGAKVIHTEHSIEYLKRRKYRLALRLLSHFCHRVVAIGMEGADFLRERVGIPAGKIEIIRAGVDVEPEPHDCLRLNSREGLGLVPQDRVAVI